MGRFVEPKVYVIGLPQIDHDGLNQYLKETGQLDFRNSLEAAVRDGLSDGEILCSFMAKLCYRSLVLGKNANVSRVRDVRANLESCHDTGHGSIFEHANINFVVTNCSRVYTHEQVRHRVGVAYSQTSGRYCSAEVVDMVFDQILVEDGILTQEEAEAILSQLESFGKTVTERIQKKGGDFTKKKKLTSAARRFLPNGQANEMGMTLNIRTLRHLVQLRTQRFAEWEIRSIYNQIYQLTKGRFPTLYHGAKERVVDGLLEVYGMKTQPYQEDK